MRPRPSVQSWSRKVFVAGFRTWTLHFGTTVLLRHLLSEARKMPIKEFT